MRSDLDRLCERLGIRAVCEYGANREPAGWAGAAHSYRVTLRKGRRRLSTDFHQGAAHTKEPTAADVLRCLVSDARCDEDFESYCADFGLSEDSRAAYATWQAARKVAPKLRRFLGEDFDAVSAAEH